jgi:branched-subunit amino acid aminotransferase/4-amino-4-deoxychorismate lyase
LLETSRANLFAVTDAGIMTARANRVLPGIGRQLVLEFARTHKIPVRAQAPRLRDWKHWRACFASNAVRGIRPVSQLGEIDLPDAREDSTVKALQEHYAEAIRS